MELSVYIGLNSKMSLREKFSQHLLNLFFFQVILNKITSFELSWINSYTQVNSKLKQN